MRSARDPIHYPPLKLPSSPLMCNGAGRMTGADLFPRNRELGTFARCGLAYADQQGVN